VTVFEARDRVGGRVHSRTLDEGSTVELGAEFILPGHDVLRATAARLALPLYEKGTLYGDREPRGGGTVTRAELLDAVARLPQAMKGTVTSALAELGLPPAVRSAIASRIEVSTAYSVDDQSAAVLASSGASFGDYASHGVAGGNQKVAQALARDLRVQLGAPVERIAWSDAAVSIRAGGTEVVADACVLAVPATTIGQIVFDPPLPERKESALNAVRYGDAAKLFVQLAEAAEPSATLSVPGRFWVYTQRAPAGGPLPVAAAFAGTRAALAALRVDEGPAHWSGAVRLLRPDLTLASAAPVLSTWHDDPWARGAYSVRSLASPLADDALAEPVGRLAFAGEHTAGEWHGLMEGALRSGVRAARDVLGPAE
jgi:monoamine oxidase